MWIHGIQYNVQNATVYNENGKELKGVSEFTTPTIQDCPGGDTTVISTPYRYKYNARAKR